MASTLRNYARAILGYWLPALLPNPGFFARISRINEYIQDWKQYNRLAGEKKLDFANSFPNLLDNTSTTSFDKHYFYQAVWASNLIWQSEVNSHFDIGSEIKFVGMLSARMKTFFIDIRPIKTTLSDLVAISGSIIGLPFPSQSIHSLSCLHVAEHIGLGRYGDTLDPDGTRKACNELKRVLKADGSLYFSVPVGKERVCFNAHRVFNPQTILDYFAPLTLLEFSAVPEGKHLVRFAPFELVNQSSYSLGLFHFKAAG